MPGFIEECEWPSIQDKNNKREWEQEAKGGGWEAQKEDGLDQIEQPDFKGADSECDREKSLITL